MNDLEKAVEELSVLWVYTFNANGESVLLVRPNSSISSSPYNDINIVELSCKIQDPQSEVISTEQRDEGLKTYVRDYGVQLFGDNNFIMAKTPELISEYLAKLERNHSVSTPLIGPYAHDVRFAFCCFY